MDVNGLGNGFTILKSIQKQEQKGLYKEKAHFQVGSAVNDSDNTTYL